MNWLDLLIIAALVAGFGWSFRRGFIMEVVYFMAFMFGLLVAFLLYPYLLPLLEGMATPAVRTTVSFGVVFVLGALLVAALGMLLHNFIHEINLGSLDRLLGGIFGLVKVAVLISVLVVMVTGLEAGGDQKAENVDAPPYIRNSALCVRLVNTTTSAMERIPPIFESFMTHYGRPAANMIHRHAQDGEAAT